MSEQVFRGILESEELGNSNRDHEDLGTLVLLTLYLKILPIVSIPNVLRVKDKVTD